MSLTCGLITVEATPGKEPGKEQQMAHGIKHILECTV